MVSRNDSELLQSLLLDPPKTEKYDEVSAPIIITPMDPEELEVWKRDAEDAARTNAVLVTENTMNEIFDNRAYIHPHGLTHHDYSSIPKVRRAGLEKFKMRIRHENYSYLHQQSDLDALIQLFLRKLLLVQPPDPIRFAAEFFAKKNKSGNTVMPDDIEDQKKKIERYRLAHPKVKMPTVNSLLLKRPGDLFSLQSLGIQPHAYDFKFEGEKLPPPKIEEPIKEPPKKRNCGCKDPGKKVIFKPEKAAVVLKGQHAKEIIQIGGENVQIKGNTLSVDASRGLTPISTADEDESTAEGSLNYEADDDYEDEPEDD